MLASVLAMMLAAAFPGDAATYTASVCQAADLQCRAEQDAEKTRLRTAWQASDHWGRENMERAFEGAEAPINWKAFADAYFSAHAARMTEAARWQAKKSEIDASSEAAPILTTRCSTYHGRLVSNTKCVTRAK